MDSMWLYITIAILFSYTLLLIAFFMGWCTLFPNKCHPRRSIPFSSVKSPRRNTKFVEIDCVSSSHSAESIKHILPEKYKKHSLPVDMIPPKRLNDYLHPKYSLPPVTIDLEKRWEFERIYRAKIRASSCGPSHQDSITSIEEERESEVPSPSTPRILPPVVVVV